MSRISTSANGDNLSHIERRHGSGNGVTTMQDTSAAALLANRESDLRAATPGERVMISLLHEISGKLDTLTELARPGAELSALMREDYLQQIERRKQYEAERVPRTEPTVPAASESGSSEDSSQSQGGGAESGSSGTSVSPVGSDKPGDAGTGNSSEGGSPPAGEEKPSPQPGQTEPDA